MKPVNFLDDAPVAAAAATRTVGAATDAAAAARTAELARVAAAARATGTAAKGGGEKPPPKKSKVEVIEGEETFTVEPRVEDLRAQQRAVREANPVPEFMAKKGGSASKLARVAGDVAEVAGWTGVLGPIAGPVAASAVDRMNTGGRRTTAQTVADVARAPLLSGMIEDVVGSDRYTMAKAAASEYVPDIVRTAASYVPPVLSGPLGATIPGAVVAFSAGGTPEKRNIAGREVVVYPRYAEMRARDQGPARLVREAREAETPRDFEWRRNNLRMAFGLAKKDYKDSVGAADRTSMAKTTTDKQIEAAALKARAQLQKVVDLREALRELQEPEDKLSID